MITFDGIVYSLQAYGGISVYFNAMLEGAKTANVPFELLVGVDRLQGRPSIAVQTQWRPVLERAFERYRDFACDSSLAHSSYFRLPAVTGRAKPKSVVTVYDFTYERYFTRGQRLAHCWQKYRAIRNADAVLCISESTRRDLFKFVPDADPRKVAVTHLAANTVFFDCSGGDAMTAAALIAAVPASAHAAGYLIYVGSRRTYKNFGPLVQALKELPLHLVCVGGGAMASPEEIAATHALSGRLHHVNWADDRLLRALYCQAVGLVFPSLYEGFGIPLVEAMAAGCPVVASNVSSLPEVAGNAGLMLNDVNADTLRRAILDIQVPTRRSEMIERGFEQARRFTWPRCFEATLNAYSDLCGFVA